MALRTLDDVLAHVGPLDDAPGPETGRERFRRHLADNIQNLRRLREYVDTCLGSPDEQHARALQDLINQLGLALGLEVEFGPYERLPGSIGYDGRWTFASGDQIVLEVKRHETFADQRSTLARVIEQLVREKQIADFKSAVGLHIIADPHLDPGHLERSILAEQPSPLQLRTIRPESLFSLARLCVRNSLSQADLLALLRAAPPAVDPIVEIIWRTAAARSADAERSDLEIDLGGIAEGVGQVIDRIGECLEEMLEAVFGSDPWWDCDRCSR